MAQIAPVWLNKSATIDRIKEYIIKAAKDNCELVVFGEALLPGYPFWVSMTNGAQFDSKVQKEIHAHYIKNSVQIEAGEFDDIGLDLSLATWGATEVSLASDAGAFAPLGWPQFLLWHRVALSQLYSSGVA